MNTKNYSNLKFIETYNRIKILEEQKNNFDKFLNVLIFRSFPRSSNSKKYKCKTPYWFPLNKNIKHQSYISNNYQL